MGSYPFDKEEIPSMLRKGVLHPQVHLNIAFCDRLSYEFEVNDVTSLSLTVLQSLIAMVNDSGDSYGSS